VRFNRQSNHLTRFLPAARNLSFRWISTLGHDLADRFPLAAEAVAALPAHREAGVRANG
jgi:hypothetical protein